MAIALRSGLLAALVLGGCSRPLRYEAPTGFAVAEHDWRSAHYKASDNVGLKLLVFDNVEGGTLEYWGQDLTNKLRARGYSLEDQSPLRSPNKVAGTRFDFGLDHPDGQTPPQFLVVNLYVTDDYRYVAQIAGDEALFSRYDGRVERLLEGLRPRGCRARSEICRGPQPARMLEAPPSLDRP